MAPISHMNWGDYPNVYSDIEMSRAASELGVVMSKDNMRRPTRLVTAGWVRDMPLLK